VTIELPPGDSDLLSLRIRIRPWVPRQLIAGSGDPRSLGLSLVALTLRAQYARSRPVSANMGEWNE
jgi:hypothetical protein